MQRTITTKQLKWNNFIQESDKIRKDQSKQELRRHLCMEDETYTDSNSLISTSSFPKQSIHFTLPFPASFGPWTPGFFRMLVGKTSTFPSSAPLFSSRTLETLETSWASSDFDGHDKRRRRRDDLERQMKGQRIQEENLINIAWEQRMRTTQNPIHDPSKPARNKKKSHHPTPRLNPLQLRWRPTSISSTVIRNSWAPMQKREPRLRFSMKEGILMLLVSL